MLAWIRRYTHWLHSQWPAGTVEKLPEVTEDGLSSVPGVLVTGDLTGIPLLKFALDSGAKAARRVGEELKGGRESGGLDLVIIGAGVSGMAAAVEARKLGLSFQVIEAAEPYFTIANFPKQKPIYTYPAAMNPAGELSVAADVKEELLQELRQQTADVSVKNARVVSIKGKSGSFAVHLVGGDALTCRRVIVAIGRSGDFRRLDVSGEDLPKVYNRLHDPQDFNDRHVLVVGGGDSALEAAAALDASGARVTLSYRGKEFSRPKPENVDAVERPGSDVDIMLESTVQEIREEEVSLATPEGAAVIPNEAVFPMIGREPPLDFFRRSRMRIAGELGARSWIALAAFVLFCAWLYNWKSGGWFSNLWYGNNWFPTNLQAVAQAADPGSLWKIITTSASGPAFWYTLAYSLIVVVFGFLRIRRRKTPYITVQTVTLMLIQVIPLFLLPEIVLPWLDKSGLLNSGLADALFPSVDYGHGREFWRAYGLILAWPLNVYNVMTQEPLWAWIGIGFVQTFVLIPLGIYFFGKGVYCGWICSCGALAETLGDTLRNKMPHGPVWNRLNMVGQGVLAVAVILLVFRVLSWVFPDAGWLSKLNAVAKDGAGAGGIWRWFNYKWTVDVLLAGILGYGLYFWFSGRVWCRFACPLAALMHIYARFSRFRIFADKKKCISCNVCTTVCHQGIDVMNFANKGRPMEDPECVRCSACVQSCPTGVLTFGRLGPQGDPVYDRLSASPVQIKES